MIPGWRAEKGRQDRCLLFADCLDCRLPCHHT